MNTIQKVYAREILDSRGNPTIECEITLDNGIKAWSSVPSGTSTGVYEAVELRDKEKRMYGKGVQKAIKNIHEIIAPEIRGMNPINQKQIDRLMIDLDGTGNKSKLGANAILAVSLCIARLGAIVSGKKIYEYIRGLLSDKELFIPRPFFNIINGGSHAGNTLAFQEFMISPNLDSFRENYFAAAEIYQTLKQNLKKEFGGNSTLLGDEGGFAPHDVDDIYQAMDILMKAIDDTGYTGKVDIALDVAASEFYINNHYDLGYKTEQQNIQSTKEMIDLYLDLCEKYPIVSIEDPFDQTDFDSFAQLRESLGYKNVQIVGDDLTVTNHGRIEMAQDKKSCNSLLLKINQIGTITESIEAAQLAQSYGWTVMVSHRSGETIDDFIADFAVGIGAEQVKFGAPARGERVVKYNRLLSIDEKIKPHLD